MLLPFGRLNFKIKKMINQIELSEQFEKIFTNEEVHDFYEQWRSENNNQSTFWTKTRHIISYIIMGCIILLCVFSIWDDMRDKVEQKIMDEEFVTFVWKDQDIIKSWYTPIDSVTDSIKTAQYKAGKELLKILK